MVRQALPADKGVYVLLLRLVQATNLSIGALGEVRFDRGDYLYVGSAFGPGGLRARLGRHLQGEGNMYWHIDTLRRAAQPAGYCYYIPKLNEREYSLEEGLPTQPFECRWSQALAALPEVSTPVPGFGASDCKSGCISHLVIINPLRNPSGIDRLMPRLTEMLARSIHIKLSELHPFQSLTSRERHT